MVHTFWNWFLTVTGSNNTSGVWYGFWSGFGSDLGEVAIIGAGIGIFRKHNCHVQGCWRIGKHPVEGTPYIVCRKHHPGISQEKVSFSTVKQAHKKAR